MKKIVVYGNGQYARLMFQVSKDEGCFEIVAFAADAEFIRETSLFGLPVVEFETVDRRYPPSQFDMMVLIGAIRVRDRKHAFEKAKAKGYRLPNYVGTQVSRYGDLEMGQNNLIFNGAYLGPGGSLGDNNMLRPNCYVGHDFHIGSHNYIAPGCNIGGYSRIGESCYIGIGSTVIQSITIADETLVGAGSLLLRDTEHCGKYYGHPARKTGQHKERGIELLPAGRDASGRGLHTQGEHCEL